MIEKRNVKGIELACWRNRDEWKEGDNFVVFIHGSGGNHTNWYYQYTAFGSQVNVAVLELPGHGSSQGSGESTVEAYVDWVRAALETFEIKKPVLVGHSLGAAIALTYAIKYGGDLVGIVPVGGGVKMPVNPEILEGLLKDPRPIFEFVAKISVSKKNRERFFESLLNDFLKVPPMIFRGDLIACNRLDISEAVKKINVASLIVCGAEDKMTSPKLSEELKASIPGSRLVIIEDAGHFVMMEQAQKFNEVLGQFIEELTQ
ncbi:MAG: alpha/beta hydrolase [Syntrophales bacterium]|nr:alpha/beta hydrolase [Syntrophales bacterium]